MKMTDDIIKVALVTLGMVIFSAIIYQLAVASGTGGMTLFLLKFLPAVLLIIGIVYIFTHLPKF